MTSVTIRSSMDEEMDRLITLCTYISQVASRIRLMHLSNVSFSPDFIQFYHHQLLSMAENVEGSAVLLESLLTIERRQSIPVEAKKPRYCYTREGLLKIREYVTPSLSTQVRHSLNLVVEQQSNYSFRIGKTSWRNVRVCLAENSFPF